MAKSIRPHIIGDSLPDLRLAPKHLTKQEFGRRVYEAMLNAGLSQSDLARASDLNRDAISTYVRGKSLPSPANLERLAAALHVEASALLPNYHESAIDHDFPALEIKISPSSPGTAWLRVNRLVTVPTALKIAELLEADHANDRSRDSAPASMQRE